MSTQMPTGAPPGVPESLITPQGNVPAIGIGTSQDYPRLVFAAPYFETVAIAEIIQPSVTEAVENVLPSLVPPYVDNAVLAGIQQYAVLLTGSTMSGPLFLNPLMPTADSQAATKAYVDTMLATAGIPEVPPVPVGQLWGRETGQWAPIDLAGGTFLPLTGGSMQGNINMSGNTLTNMAAVPAMPNGAAPAQWVLNQLASVSLYQGTWNADTNTPDLTQLSTHVNAYTWIAITTSPSGVVIGPAIPGLQGMTVFNGDTIIYSTAQGQFSSIHAGGISLPEADGRYVQLAGSQMSGALLLNADASQPMQATTYEQLQAAVANTVTPDAPADGQAYLRLGVGTTRWVPGLPLSGGILTGALTLSGPGASGNNAVTVAQMNSAVSGVAAGLMPIAGGTFTGPVILAGNASTNLNPVPLQQMNAMLATYATQAFVTGGFLALSGGTLTGPLNINSATSPALNITGAGSNATINGTLTAGALVSNGVIDATGAISGASLAASGNLNVSGNIIGVAGTSVSVGSVSANNFNSNTTINAGGTISGANINASGSMTNINMASTGVVSVAPDAVPGSYTAGTVIGNAGVRYNGVSGANFMGFTWGSPNLNCTVDGTYVGALQPVSDPRLKSRRAAPQVDALAVLGRVSLEQFVMKGLGPGSVDRHWSLGFMSDQLAELIPEAVNPGDGETSFDTINTLSPIAYLIGAVQQLSARLATLEAPA